MEGDVVGELDCVGVVFVRSRAVCVDVDSSDFDGEADVLLTDAVSLLKIWHFGPWNPSLQPQVQFGAYTPDMVAVWLATQSASMLQ